MWTWNKCSSVCKCLATVAAVRKQNGIWNVQREHQPVNTKGVCLSFYVLPARLEKHVHWIRQKAGETSTNFWNYPICIKLEAKVRKIGSILIRAKWGTLWGSVLSVLFVTSSQTVIHGVRRYWARGIALVQHVSGAGADCWLRGMSAAKALTLLTLL